ncbi:MAG: UTP--glucose-1-phosphate uridylyltransferase [Bryobacterales bacterium]|nr:UTP--glucose-1-phosphate uridylyltransferase [Bryobacterales bacterium]
MAGLIDKALVPVAGRGTRLLPATKAQPKEMLPVGGKPVVQHVVEELAHAGVRDLLFVTARGKGSIEDHFEPDPDLIEALRKSGKQDLVPSVDASQLVPNVYYTRQPVPRGLGDAIQHGRAFVGNEPFIVALGDSIIGLRGGATATRRTARVFVEWGADAAVAVEEVRPDQVASYGIVRPMAVGEVFRVATIVEKPEPKAAPSRLAVAGRYIFSPTIFQALQDVRPDANGEIQLTDAIRSIAEGGGKVIGVRLRRGEERYDIGNLRSYYETFFRFALADAEHGSRLRAYLRSHMTDRSG